MNYVAHALKIFYVVDLSQAESPVEIVLLSLLRLCTCLAKCFSYQNKTRFYSLYIKLSKGMRLLWSLV